MNDERDALLQEIGRELSVDVSPAFRARVREAIDRPRARRFNAWQWFGVVATAATVVLAVTISREGHVTSSRPRAIANSAVAGRLRTPPAVSSKSSQSAVAQSRPQNQSQRAPLSSSTQRRGRASEPESTHEVLVDPSQLEGLKQMFAAAERRASASVEPIVISPIEVAPLKLAALFESDPSLQGEHQ